VHAFLVFPMRDTYIHCPPHPSVRPLCQSCFQCLLRAILLKIYSVTQELQCPLYQNNKFWYGWRNGTLYFLILLHCLIIILLLLRPLYQDTENKDFTKDCKKKDLYFYCYYSHPPFIFPVSPRQESIHNDYNSQIPRPLAGVMNRWIIE
jgi:hypothetical protein